MTRIAYIVDSFRYGGLERCVARMVEGLDGGRFRPVVVCLKTSGTAAEWIRSDVPVYELHKRAGNDWSVVKRLADVLRSERIDVVHSHNWGTLVETVLARRRAKTPVHVHAQRGMFYHGRDVSWWRQAARRAATRWACRRVERVVAVAEAVRDDLCRSWGVGRELIEVIPNGVDVPAHDRSGQAARKLRASLGVAEEAIVIGSVGRLVSVKDFPTLIAAVQKIKPADRPAHLVVVGDGPEMEPLQRCVARLPQPGRVHLVGAQSNVGDWLAAMDVYVNSSLSEGMSQSILEAMAMGLPIVATDVGANRELVEGEPACGLIVPAGRCDLLAGALIRMMSPERRAEFGERARDRHRMDYDAGPMVAAYAELYESLCSPHQSFDSLNPPERVASREHHAEVIS